MSLYCVVPAANEPISLAEFCAQVREDVPDDTSPEAIEFGGYIAAARSVVESYCRRVLVLQTWRMEEHRHHEIWRRLEESLYVRRADHGVRLPYAPLLAVDYIRYRSEGGAFTDAPCVVDRGSRTQPGTIRLLRRAEFQDSFTAETLEVQWRAGYGGDIAIVVDGLTVTGYPFTQSDVGLPLAGDKVATVIASVDEAGMATVAAALPDGSTTAYLGFPVPPQILQTIKLLAADLYANREASTLQQGSDGGTLPSSVQMYLAPYRNMLS